MNHIENSTLQTTYRLAKELEVFTFDNLARVLPAAKEKTIKRYLSAMVKNGNLLKDGEEYLFVEDKPISVKIGG